MRRETGLPVTSAWGFSIPADAERSVAEKCMDLVMVCRAHLANPHWPYAAARALTKDKAAWVLPAPYAHWLERYRTA